MNMCHNHVGLHPRWSSRSICPSERVEDAFDVSFQQISLGYLVLISGDLVISYGFWAKRERFMRDSIPRHQANSLPLFRF